MSALVTSSPSYDKSIISTVADYDKNIYKQIGVVSGIAVHGVSLTKSLFSSVRAAFGQRETNVEHVYTDAFDNAVIHMLQNAKVLYPNYKRVVGVMTTLNSPNPETVSCLVYGTVLALRTDTTRKIIAPTIFTAAPLQLANKTKNSMRRYRRTTRNSGGIKKNKTRTKHK